MSKSGRGAMWGIVLGLVASAATLGQTQEGTLETIVVTAQKRSESIQDVPTGITALTEETLVHMGADAVEDYARSVPGLNFASLGPGGRVKLSIRGINPNTGTASVGFYIDEVPIPTNVGFVNLINIDPKLFDVQRIEVLKGPQGTLYGSNSMAGLVKVVTNQPDTKGYQAGIGGSAATTTGGGQSYGLDGLANAPVSDTLAVRMSVYQRQNGGYIDRIYQSQSAQYYANTLLGQVENTAKETTTGGRLVLGYYPTANFSLDLSAYAETTAMDGYAAIDGGARNPDKRLVFNQPLNVAEPYQSDWQLYSATLKWGLASNLNLTSVTSEFYRHFALTEDGTEQLIDTVGLPPDGQPLPAPIEEITDVKSFTQEIRLASVQPFHGLGYLFGVFYNKVDGNRGSNWIVPGSNAAYSPALPVPDDNWFTAINIGTNAEKAVFGELSYDITSQFNITVGARRFDLYGDEHGQYNGVFSGGYRTDSAQYDNKKTDLKFSASWHVTPDNMLYARAAQGFRPGQGQPLLPTLCNADLVAAGFDPNHPPTQANPDSIWNYEVGDKATGFGGQMVLDGTVFYIDWKDIQQQLLLQCGFIVLVNAGHARSQGAELELSLLPTDRLELSLDGSYTDATFLSNQPNLGITKGDRVLEVPKFQFAVSATYRQPIKDPFEGYLRADVQHVSDSWLSFDEVDPLTRRPAYTITNLRAGVHEGTKWDFALYMENVFDERADLGHPDSLTFNIPSRPRIVIARPRTIGFSVHRSW